ncbi:nicotinate-nucleotide adenylyltransferase [bacterium]|nr:nicotinate-nucleotide adenylyltransferase [bacterium]
MKIGIFGGTFDPPHIGHLILAEFVRDEIGLDEVWLVPALDPPHKLDRHKTPADIRYEMVKLACGNDAFIRPSDIDLVHSRRPSYTIDLLDEISLNFPDNEFVQIIGEDSIAEFTLWKSWNEILKKYRIIGLRRRGIDLTCVNNEVISSVEILNNPLIELSSTEIRKRIINGKSVRYMVSERVWDFIFSNKVYKK